MRFASAAARSISPVKPFTGTIKYTGTNNLFEMNIQEVRQLASGNFEIIKILISQGEVDVNSTDTEGKNFLHHAMEIGSPSEISYFLSINVNAQLYDQRGRTPLYYAFAFEEYYAVRSFIDFHLKRATGQLLLYFQMMGKMLYGGYIGREIRMAEDIDFRKLVFETPLRVAIILENKNYVRQLLEAGANRHIIKNPREIRILQEAFLVGEVEVLQKIFELTDMNQDELQYVRDHCSLGVEMLKLLNKFEEELSYVQTTYVGKYNISRFMKEKRTVQARMVRKKLKIVRRIEKEATDRGYIFTKKFCDIVDLATKRQQLLDCCKSGLQSYRGCYIEDHLFEKIFRYFNTVELSDVSKRLSVSK